MKASPSQVSNYYNQLMKYLFILFFVIFFVSCEDNSNKIDKEQSKTIPVSIEEAKEIPMSELFSKLQYITLKTDSENQIGRITKIQVTDKYIALLDDAKKGVWIFTRMGSLLNFIAVPDGNGPGEVTFLFDFDIDDQNRIHAIGRFKMVVYNLDGTLQNEFTFKYPGYKFSYFSESDIYAIYTYGSSYQTGQIDNTGSNIIFIDSSGKLQETALPVQLFKGNIKIIIPDNFPSFNGKQLFVGHPDPVVYQIEPGSLKERYILDFGNHSVPPETYELRENYTSETRFIVKEILDKGFITFIMRVLETKKWAIFDFQVANGKRHYAIHDKTKDTTGVASHLVNDIDYGLSPFFDTATDSKIFTIVQPNDLLKRLQKIKQENPELLRGSKMQNLLNLTDTLSTFDNPIIMEATVKPN